MFTALALSLAVVPASTDELTSLFLNACVNGQVRLTSEQSKAVSPERAPWFIRDWVSKDPQVRLYHLEGSRFLLISHRDAADKANWVSRCLVIGRFDLSAAWKNVLAALFKGQAPSSAFPRDVNSHEVLLPSRKTAIVVSSYVVDSRMEVITFDDEAWNRLFKNVGKVPKVQSSYKPFGIGRDY